MAEFTQTANIVAQALTEYGAAIRGDWSELDGRSVRNQLDELAGVLRNQPDPAPSIEQLRNKLGVCPAGGGHWTEYCEGTPCGTPSRMGGGS